MGSEFWYAEEKIDGDRFSLTVDGDKLAATGRSGMELKVPAALRSVRLAKSLASTTFDGELVNSTYHIFDLTEFHGTNYREVPYSQRRIALERLFERLELPNCELVYCAKSSDEKQALVSYCREEGKEGVIFKNVSAPYVAGRRKTWLKYKLYKTCECVVTQLCYEGKPESVEISFVDPLTNQFYTVGSCKIPDRYQTEQNVRVYDVIEVRYLDFTDGRRLYQPVFLRKRTDKQPSDCTDDQVVL